MEKPSKDDLAQELEAAEADELAIPRDPAEQGTC